MKDFLQGKWLGHPLHGFLVHVPVALWPAALMFDLLTRAGIGGNAFVQTSFFAIGLGLASALLAIPTGLADWWDIKSKNPAWKLGLYHLTLNTLITGAAMINLGLRISTFREATSVALVPLSLSFFITVSLLVSGYLGGRLVYNYGISVARVGAEQRRQRAQAGRLSDRRN
jgi:uncharacterized membrane protein